MDEREVLAYLIHHVQHLTSMVNFLAATLLESGVLTEEQIKTWSPEKKDEYLLRLTKISMDLPEPEGAPE